MKSSTPKKASPKREADYVRLVPIECLSKEQNERIRIGLQILKDSGHSQLSLAKQLGVSQGGISLLLKGKVGSSYPFAKKLATMLGMEVGDLLESKKPLSYRHVALPSEFREFEEACRYLKKERKLSDETQQLAERIVALFPCDLEFGLWLSILQRFEQAVTNPGDDDDEDLTPTPKQRRRAQESSTRR